MFNQAQRRTRDEADRTERSVNNLDDVMRSLSPSALSAVAGVTALVASLKALTGTLGQALDNYAHFEKLQMGLTTFFQDAGKGKSKFEELRKLSNETTFGVDELTDAFTQMANVGVKVSDITDRLVMLGNVAQGDKTKFADLVSIYSKIQSTGKAGSMQLQQLALRGLPIYDMLKKIGVQGTATGEDITKALQEMTKEGGQFYNAMNNINETIEGKKGFISDYFKEMTVNFAEVTGLADIYKTALDLIKEAIGAVSDKLLEWNENPVTKAIVSGVFIGMITAIGTAILVNVIPQLMTVIGLLTKIQLLSGPKGWAVLAVAGIAVATTAIISYKKSVKEATEETGNLGKAIRDAIDTSNDNNLIQNGLIPESKSRNVELENAQHRLEMYKENLDKFQEDYDKAKKEYDDYMQTYINWTLDGLYTQEQWDAEVAKLGKTPDEKSTQLNATVGQYNEKLERAKKLWQDQADEVDALKTKVERMDFSDLKKTYEEIYNSTIPKEEAQRIELQRQLDIVEQYKAKLKTLNGKVGNDGKIINYNNEKDEIDATIRYLENKLKGLNAWEDVFKNVTGIEVPKSSNVVGKTRGQLAGEKYIEETNKQFDKEVKVKMFLGSNKKDAEKAIAIKFVENIEKQISDLLLHKNVDIPFEETDATIKALNAELEKYKKIIGETADETKSFSDIIQDWKQSGNAGGMIGGAFMGQLASSSSDLSNGIEGFANGGIWGAIIEVLVGAFVRVASACEGFEEVMNPVTTSMEQLKPIIQWLVTKLAQYTKHMEAFFNVVGELFDALKPLIDFLLDSLLEPLNFSLTIIAYLLRELAPLLKGLAAGIEWVLKTISFGLTDRLKEMNNSFADTRRVVDETKRAEEERLRALKDAYSSMLSTLRDVQEEYEIRKRKINAEGYNDSVTGVHDMILTPQGRFSTDPDDYIIATKNPRQLNGGGRGDIIINNYSNAQVETSQDDLGNTVILISQKVAMDFAQGNNGWDNAVIARQARTAGRSLVM